MPWCPECDRFLSPASVLPDGSCPRCGRDVDAGRAKPPVTTLEPSAVAEEEAPDPVPWHLKLLLGAIALYLGYRAFQGIEWLVSLV